MIGGILYLVILMKRLIVLKICLKFTSILIKEKSNINITSIPYHSITMLLPAQKGSWSLSKKIVEVVVNLKKERVRIIIKHFKSIFRLVMIE